MSRSRRKTPVFAYTNSESEAKDKALWHRRWRRKERTRLASLSPDEFDAHQSADRRQVSNLWDMAKDGRHWRSKRSLEQSAEFFADCQARRRSLSEQDYAKLKLRGLRRQLSK